MVKVVSKIEAVADAADAVEELGSGGVGFYLFAEAPDMSVNGPVGDEGAGVPGGVDQLLAGENVAGGFDEDF